MGLIERITGAQPKRQFIKNAAPGAIVFARHDIPGLLAVVPGGTRGILLTWISRDRHQKIVVRWDGFGNGDAIAADLSPHFEKGSPELAKPPRRPTDAVPAASGTRAVSPQRPASRPRTVTQIVRDEPYDPKSQSPEPPLRPGETRRTVIITDEPL
jgi:hypothetical protein